MVHRVKKNENEWQQSGGVVDNKWQQRTMNDKWYNEWQRVKTNSTMSDNEWQRVIQRVTENESEWYNEWQQMFVNGSK